jgi:hypothetical protein
MSRQCCGVITSVRSSSSENSSAAGENNQPHDRVSLHVLTARMLLRPHMIVKQTEHTT